MPQPENTAFTEPGPVFRIGQAAYSKEVVDGDKRYFAWHYNPADDQFAGFATWDRFLKPASEWQDLNSRYGQEQAGWLEMPLDTSSASSVLGGMEAWKGQKGQIIDFITNYATSVYRNLGVVDTSMNLDTVCVSRREGTFFIVPPHVGEIAQPGITEWYAKVYQDLDQVLKIEPGREDLLGQFHANMSYLLGEQK